MLEILTAIVVLILIIMLIIYIVLKHVFHFPKVTLGDIIVVLILFIMFITETSLAVIRNFVKKIFRK